ncbi:hypothetical protein [Shinella sp.]|uniref:hypothetical protein n=1 Tax=unclassified Shinella TaxID=2643062 RepID=UPI0028A7992E|nr:hypothetical protein [Shinella sp.]
MRNLDEARRLNGAMHEQIRINEEIAEQSKSDAKPGEAKWAVVFILVVIFIKPFADYCSDLHNTLAGYAQSLSALFGF